MKRHLKTLNKKKKIIADYGLTAHIYDNRYKTIQEKKYNIVLKDYQLKEKSILDAGCGTGLLIDYILNSEIYNPISKCNFVALDISWNMLLEFKLKLYKLKSEAKISLILSDIENLPFRDNIFNLILSFTSIQNLPETYTGIQELYRVASTSSDLKFSILKKKLEIVALIDFLNSHVKDLEITNKELLEDIIIQGKILKE